MNSVIEHRSMFPPLFAIILIAAVIQAWPQVFEIIALDGSAKVQHVQKKDLEKVAIGSQVRDNDIIESAFQTKCVLRFGKSNIVIVGSNSKILVNIRERQVTSDTIISDVNLTLFSGACFVKALSQAHVSVYTSNAVGETENGSFSTVVESKTGETGFQVISGKVKTRNIAQKEGIDLISGQTTMIFPGKEPTAPLFITYKHVSVLKHFFGEEYIQSEMDAAGIKATEDKTSRSSALLSDVLVNGQFEKNQDVSTYKIPFSLNKIYGAILDDRMKNKKTYTRIQKPNDFVGHRLFLAQRSSFAVANGGVYPAVSLSPSYSSGAFSAGLRLSLARNYTGSFGLYGFSSAAGVLDKVDHVTWEPQNAPFSIALGAQSGLTIGSGAVVRGFDNSDPYCIFQPLGLSGTCAVKDFNAQVFIADISRFSIGGVHLALTPTVYHFGAGFFFDANQIQAASPEENNRFGLRSVSDAYILDSASTAVSIYEADFFMDFVISDNFSMSFGGGFAQKLKSRSADGFVFTPKLTMDWGKMRIQAGLVAESGRLIAGQFNSWYMSNRWRRFGINGDDTIVTQNTILSGSRSCQGVDVVFVVNPSKATALELSLRQNFREKHTFALDTVAAPPGTDFSASLKARDGLFKFLRYGEVYVRQERAGIYPPRSSVFSSWAFSAGAIVETNPLYFGIALSGDVSVGYLDMNFDNRADSGDTVIRFSIGLSRDFL